MVSIVLPTSDQAPARSAARTRQVFCKSLTGGERGGNMHREPEVAGLVRQGEARPDVTRCEQPLRQHRGEQDLTRLWLILAAQPIAPRMFERSITRLIALPLDGITGKL